MGHARTDANHRAPAAVRQRLMRSPAGKLDATCGTTPNPSVIRSAASPRRNDLRRGRCIGWLRWRETDQVIRDLLQGGINSEKARLMVREFRRLEAGAPDETVQLTGM